MTAYVIFRKLKHSLLEVCPECCKSQNLSAWAKCFIENDGRISEEMRKDIVCSNAYTKISVCF